MRLKIPGQVPRYSASPYQADRPTPTRVAENPLFEGIHLTAAQEQQILENVRGMDDVNEMALRQNLIKAMREAGVPGAERQTVLRRLSAAYVERGTDITRQVVVTQRQQGLRPAEITLAKAARGGAYHRRVAKLGGGYKYYYDAEKYAARDDAHVDGRSVLQGKCSERLCTLAGETGISIAEALERLGAKFDPDLVKDAIRSSVKSGALVHAKGQLIKKKTENAQ